MTDVPLTPDQVRAMRDSKVPVMDGFAMLSKATGIPTQEMRDIATRVKANLDTLRACAGHSFQGMAPDPLRPWDRKFQCQRCKGIIGASDHMWYERGRRDQAAHTAALVNADTNPNAPQNKP